MEAAAEGDGMDGDSTVESQLTAPRYTLHPESVDNRSSSSLMTNKREGTCAFGQMMNQLRLEHKLVDVTIVCGTKHLIGHRVVLAAASPFFETLLLDDSHKNATSTLDLEDVDAATMDELLSYVYLGHVRPASLDTEHMIHLMTTAHLLQVTGAAVYFARMLLFARPNRNMTGLWDWAEEFESLEVEQLVINYVATNLPTVWSFEDFCDLTLERLTTVLAQPTITTLNQEILMQAILTWVKHDREKRRELLPTMTCFIDFSQFSEPYMRALMREEPMVRACPDLLSLVTSETLVGGSRNAMILPGGSTSVPVTSAKLDQKQGALGRRRAQQVPTKPSSTLSQSQIPTPTVKEAPYNKHIAVDMTAEPPDEEHRSIINRGSGHVNLNRASSSHFAQQQRQPPPPPPQKQDYRELPLMQSTISTASEELDEEAMHNMLDVFLNEAMLVGGRDEANRNVIHYYRPSTRQWIGFLEVPIVATVGEGMANLETSVYIVGGEDMRKHTLRQVYEFNAKTQALRVMSSLHVPRTSPSVVCAGSLLFSVGGLSRFSMPMTHVECMDLESETWKILPSIKEKRMDPGITVASNSVYLIGGYTVRCEIFGAPNYSWQPLASLPDAFRDEPMKATTFEENKICAFRSHKPDRVCCFDMDTNLWQTLKTSGMPPEDVASVVFRQGDVWVLDTAGRLVTLDLRNLQWVVEQPVPKSLARPMHMLSIEKPPLNYV